MTGLRCLATAFALRVLLPGCASESEDGRDARQGNSDDTASVPSPHRSGADTCPEPDPPAVAGVGPAVLPDVGDGTAPQAYTVEVVDRTPHDEAAFTQGLLHADGLLYDSTGRYGESDVRLVEPKSGEVLLSMPPGETVMSRMATRKISR